MHKSSYEKMCWFRENFLDDMEYLKILDIGSLDTSNTNFNYKSIFNNNKWIYEGLDFENGNNVDILIDNIYNIPEIKSDSYDVVISGQLFEHLKFFWLTMGEIKRILKPGGVCCIIAPSDGPDHGISNDCYRFSEDGMKALATYVNFDVLHVSTNKSDEAKPWNDTCLIAQKRDSFNHPNSDINERISLLENKMDDLIINIKK